MKPSLLHAGRAAVAATALVALAHVPLRDLVVTSKVRVLVPVAWRRLDAPPDGCATGRRRTRAATTR